LRRVIELTFFLRSFQLCFFLTESALAAAGEEEEETGGEEGVFSPP